MANIDDYLEGLNYNLSPEEKQLMDIYAECWEHCGEGHCHDCEYRSGNKWCKMLICMSYQYAKRLIAAGYKKCVPDLAVLPVEKDDLELVRAAFHVEKSEWLNLLTEREAHILVLRHGLAGGVKMTYDQIGKEYGVTRERIRQIEHKAFRKLRIDYWNKEV